MIKMSAWTRLLRVIIANEPDLPALGSCLLRLRSWIAEHPEEAPRELRRRRAPAYPRASSRAAHPPVVALRAAGRMIFQRVLTPYYKVVV